MKSALPLNSFHSDVCFINNYCLTIMKVCKMCRLVRFHSATQKESHVKHTQLFSQQTVKSIQEKLFFQKTKNKHHLYYQHILLHLFTMSVLLCAYNFHYVQTTMQPCHPDDCYDGQSRCSCHCDRRLPSLRHLPRRSSCWK